jgi:hypothetical protein
MNDIDITDWEITDQDNLQFRKCRTYKFREFNRKEYPDLYNTLSNHTEYLWEDDFFKSSIWKNPLLWIDDEIDLDNMTFDELNDIVTVYGYTMDLSRDWVRFVYYNEQIDDEYNVVDSAVVAECVFEQTNGLY